VKNVRFLYAATEASKDRERRKTAFLARKRDHVIYPVIGIPYQANYQPTPDQLVYRNRHAYVHAVESAGGLPILIPVHIPFSDLENLLPRFDGLLFAGGVDIQPGLYGEQKHSSVRVVDPQLDAFEVALATWALQRDLPILGICRGMQLINVILGGTLYQDISAQYPDSLEHWRRDLSRTELVHPVTIEQGSLMEQILRTRQLFVNSLHHQAVKDPGKGIRLCGWADDGIAELLEAPEYRFVMGVQGHPEEIYQAVPAFAHLFQAFITSCSQPSAEPVAPLQPIPALQRLQPDSVRGLFPFSIPGEELESPKAA